MPGDRKNIPVAGSETSEDLESEFTYEEMVADILDELGDGLPPSPKDGWMKLIGIAARAKGLSLEQTRRRIERGVKDGIYETLLWQKCTYVRKVKQANE